GAGSSTPAALLVSRSQLLPTIVRHSRRPWRSNTAEYSLSSRLVGAALRQPRCWTLYFDQDPKDIIKTIVSDVFGGAWQKPTSMKVPPFERPQTRASLQIGALY
ncbi:MAG: hypothetical protein ACI8W7_004296, partial [Gammaproteobacteria bacterium]